MSLLLSEHCYRGCLAAVQMAVHMRNKGLEGRVAVQYVIVAPSPVARWFQETLCVLTALKTVPTHLF